MLFFTSICHSTTLECLQLVKKRELGNYCSLECHGMTKARFWLLCWVTVLVWQHPFTSSFPGVLREQPMSLQAGRCLLFKSILFNLGVVLSGILSAQILAASVTPFVSKSHIQTLNAGGNQLKKSPSFSCLPKISKKRSDRGANRRVSKVFRIQTEFRTCWIRFSTKKMLNSSLGFLMFLHFYRSENLLSDFHQ